MLDFGKYSDILNGKQFSLAEFKICFILPFVNVTSESDLIR